MRVKWHFINQGRETTHLKFGKELDMDQNMNRRAMLQNSVVVGAGMLASSSVNALGSKKVVPSDKKPMKKAVKLGMVREGKTLIEKFALLKELGFDGVEMSSPNGYKLEDVINARDKTGLPIHGVVDSVHWQDTLSHPDKKVRQKGVKGLQTAIRDAKAYGASSVLIVPAVVSKKVAYHDAYRRSQAEIKKVIPLAENSNIRILLENVWNNFLLSPMEMARYVDELESKMMGVYFDVGNIVRYAWPEQWIRVLGKRIVKFDVKGYSRKLQNSKGPWAGFNVKIGDGDCDWPAVMKAFDEVGYRGWATAEVGGGNRERLKEIAKRMDRVLKRS